MKDLGQPSSYLALEPGAPVYSRDGEELGKVEHVLRDADADIFDGLVLGTGVLPGGHRFIDGDHVEEVYERGVRLKLDRAAAEAAPEPSENPAVVAADPDETAKSDLQRKLRRAWDLISGNY
jgi:uncharacterized protein YrrD